MSSLKLFGDRISHPSRACLMLLKSTPAVEFEERSVSLFKGEQHTLKELPLKQVPVLHHGNKIIAQSTTILRYAASNFCERPWYEDPKTRFHVDEYFDFWQERSLIKPNYTHSCLLEIVLIFKYYIDWRRHLINPS